MNTKPKPLLYLSRSNMAKILAKSGLASILEATNLDTSIGAWVKHGMIKNSSV